MDFSYVGVSFEGNDIGDDDWCEFKFDVSIVWSLLITALAVPVLCLPFIMEVFAATVF